MAQRTIFDFTQPTIATPTVSPDMSGANLLNQVSRTLGNIGAQQRKEWQDATIKKSAQEGLMEGTQEQPKYRTEGTLSAEAFNQAAKKSYTANLEMKASHQMSAFAEEFKNDPEGYEKASTGYINGMREELVSNKQTESMAALMEGRLKLDQQAAGYNISKRYMANKTAELRVENDNLIQTIRTNTYKEAGGIFSSDSTSKNLALQRFALNKKALDASLHQVGPDGTPIFTPEAVAARQQAFHREFYTRAVTDWVSENEISDEQYMEVMDGTLNIDIEGLGQINILDEVGPDGYDKLKRTVTAKEVERMNFRKKVRQEEKAEYKEAQLMTGTVMIAEIGDGVPYTSSQIMTMQKNGRITSTDARNALKMINNPEMIQEDMDIAAELYDKAVAGEDVGQMIKNAATSLKPSTVKRLLKIESDVANKAARSLESEDLKWIKAEMVQTDMFGMADPRELRLARDMQDFYLAQIENGVEQPLAMEKARNAIDAYKSNENKMRYNSVPKYMELDITNSVDIAKTLDATDIAFDKGLLSEAEYMIEVKRLEAIMQQ